MGEICIIARRMKDGTGIQYGIGGDGKHFRKIGTRLLKWYDEPEAVDNLFRSGQTALIGKLGSVKGEAPWESAPEAVCIPHWTGDTERAIFYPVLPVRCGYLYDSDNTWYCITPGPFHVKIPLGYMHRHLDGSHSESQEYQEIHKMLTEYIIEDFYNSDEELQSIVAKYYTDGIAAVRKDAASSAEGFDPLFLQRNYWRIFAVFCKHFFQIVASKNGESCISILENIADPV